MLKFLSGRKRSRNAFLVFFIGVLTLSLIGLFSVVVGGGASGLFGATGDNAAVAKVGSYKVTVKELRDALNSFGQEVARGQGRVGGPDPNSIDKETRSQVLDQLIKRKVILYEAERLNIGATDEDVQARIRQIPGLNPWPGAEQYRYYVQQSFRMTPLDFEEKLVRPSIAEEHLKSYITAGVEVSLDEVKEDYRRSNTNYNVRWVEVNTDKFRDKVHVNDDEMRKYFEDHKNDYQITVEERRARYIFVDQKKAEAAVQIPEEELKKTFEAAPDQYVQRVRVSQIVLNIPKDAKEEDVRKKAQDLVSRARGAEGKAAEDFAKLVQEASEDAKTKAKGGDIGWVNKKDVEKNTQSGKNDPLSSVFRLKQGEVSDPVLGPDKVKFYIFKVTDRKVPSFAEVRDEVLKNARAGKGYDKAVEIIREAETRLKETKNPDAVAAEINKKYGSDVAVVKDTGSFAQGEELPDLGEASEFQSAIFALQNINDVTTWMPVNEGFAVAMYTGKLDPHTPAYEEVKDKVERDYRKMKASEMALDLARQMAKAKTPDELQKAAEDMIRQYGGAKKSGTPNEKEQPPVKLDERAGLRLGDSIGQLTTDADREPVYKLNAGEVTSEPIKTENGNAYVVAAMLSKQEPSTDDAEFEKQRKSITDRLLDAKRNTFFDSYLTMTVDQLKKDGTIKVYDDVIAKAFEAGASQQSEEPQIPAQPQMPGLPGRSPNAPRRTPQGPVGLPPGAMPGRQ